MVVRPDGNYLEVQAPAKLNLHLEILARRNDGFHEIETLMVPVSLYDTLQFAPCSDSRMSLECAWAGGLTASEGALGDLPPAETNIVYRAVDLLRREAGIDCGAHIRVFKRIPSQAGLGGASSNAAAALLAANEGWKLHWGRERLSALASRLGSDIPFFFSSSAAIARGRGEQIQPLGRVVPIAVVVVRPAEGLSTPAVYKACRVSEQPAKVDAICHFLQSGDASAVAQVMMNRLQEPAEQLCPAVARLREAFARTDCLGHQMSGSGSSYFGICHNSAHARRVAARLRAMHLGLVAWGTAGAP